MPPFPGMDPFIEDQEWSDFHPSIVVQLQAQLAPQIEPQYYVRVERRIYVEHPNDEVPQERRESFLKIHETDTREVVTVLEALSPSNKRREGDGRREYLSKRDEVLRTVTHLVELDLLRGGERLPIKPPVSAGDFYAIVSRCQRRPWAEVYAWSLTDPLPKIAIPLKEGDADVPLDLGAALTAVYDRARYQLSIEYKVPLEHPVSAELADWLANQLRAHHAVR